MRVEIYYNLHRSCWSVAALEGPHKGLVIGYCQSALVAGARFTVSLAGNARVIREGRKNVHAFVRGRLLAVSGWEGRHIEEAPCDALEVAPRLDQFVRCVVEGRGVTYRPFEGAYFKDRQSGACVDSASVVALTNDRKVYARGAATVQVAA